MKKRFLKFHFPEMDSNPELPVCLNYTQLYTGVTSDEEGKIEEPYVTPKISAKEYQIPEINLYPLFHKPISKCVKVIKNARTTEE